MADTVDKATRSRMMAAIKGRDTKPELDLRRMLWASGVRGYRTHRRDIAGRPDLAWVGARVAVFVDGGFWHGHPSAFTWGKSGEYWDRKIARNIERDAAVNDELLTSGWTVVRVWDFEVSNAPQAVVDLINGALAAARGKSSRPRSVVRLSGDVLA